MRAPVAALLALLVFAVLAPCTASGSTLHNLTLSIHQLPGGPGVASDMHMVGLGLVWLEPGSQGGVYTDMHYLAVGVEALEPSLGAGIASDLHVYVTRVERIEAGWSGLATDMHVLAVKLGLPGAPTVEDVELLGCGGYACVGASQELVVTLGGEHPAARLVLRLLSGGETIAEVSVDLAAGSWSGGGGVVTGVEVSGGRVSFSLRMPWSLGDRLVAEVVAVGYTGASTSYEKSFEVIRSFDVVFDAPGSVAPGEEFTVTLRFYYRGTSVPAPEGMLVEVNGTRVYTGEGGVAVVRLVAPGEPGSYNYTLLVRIPEVGQEEYLVIPLRVVGASGAGAQVAALNTSRARGVTLGGAIHPLSLLYSLAAASTAAILAVAARRGGRLRSVAPLWAAVVLVAVVVVASILVFYYVYAGGVAPVATKTAKRPVLVVRLVEASYNESSGVLTLTLEVFNAGDEPLTLDAVYLEDSLGNLYVGATPPVTVEPRASRLVGVVVRTGGKPACPCIIRVSAGGLSAYTSIEGLG